MGPSRCPCHSVHPWVVTELSLLAQTVREPARGRVPPCRVDLRGHGMSEAPEALEHYTDSQLWADDIAAIVEQLNLKRPVLVGWSYGGFVICDYIRAYGQDAIAGINFVGAAVTLDSAAFGILIGPGFLDHVPGATANDLPSNIEAIRAFLYGCTARPLPRDQYEMALSWNIVVSPKVRAALVTRVIDCDDVLRRLERPVLTTRGPERHCDPAGNGRSHPENMSVGDRVLVPRDWARSFP